MRRCFPGLCRSRLSHQSAALFRFDWFASSSCPFLASGRLRFINAYECSLFSCSKDPRQRPSVNDVLRVYALRFDLERFSQLGSVGQHSFSVCRTSPPLPTCFQYCEVVSLLPPSPHSLTSYLPVASSRLSGRKSVVSCPLTKWRSVLASALLWFNGGCL